MYNYTNIAMAQTSNEDKIDHLAELMDRYGVTLVISALFVILAIILFKNFLDDRKDQKNIIEELIQDKENNKKTTDEILITIKKQTEMIEDTIKKIDEISNNYPKLDSSNKPKTHKGLVTEFLNINEPLRHLVDSIGEGTDCERTAIYVFHNGNNSTHGIPFVKLTCLYEHMKRGTNLTRKISTHSSMSITLFGDTIDYVNKSGALIIPNPEQIENEFPVMASIYRKSKVNSGILMSLYDKDNNLLGLLVTEFENKVSKEELLEKTLPVMKEYESRLSEILDYCDYANQLLITKNV